ncbi:hypothetical protein HYZ41_04555 [archaeon]|nr:hypothetical protein [archaeon]
MEYASGATGFIEKHPIVSLTLGIGLVVGAYEMFHGKSGIAYKNAVNSGKDVFNIFEGNDAQESIKYVVIADETVDNSVIDTTRDYDPQKDIGI